ncbi:NAD(P)/FAD-dependent oxidoreductase [Streptomyces sp. N2-109]|uniref:NAD(P)/FAD-dependent oxidoreductase n=1 Tax=Streptomyces gossypii TaxID=2883101 RepID=A0ABT2K394_9ACTN|nr:FAD/NAD(P)-binding oxidoreductase [Streptomyces gossypii]MCT2594645.1 NAD(P)/FAD-dependent oxidoreductase [Streptomyces gossypii]
MSGGVGDARVVVVGAGPAGMAAARAAAEAGAPVLLIDSGPGLGGQYHRQNALARQERFTLPDGVEHLPDSVVWALEKVPAGHRVHVRTGPADGPGRRGRSIDTRALVLATGAYDRALPFPGWDLPGVTTAGAAQAMAKGQGVRVGERVLLAGTGPFLLPVAESLTAVGSRVLGVLEANDPAAGWLTEPAGLLAGRGKTGELAGYAALLARHRIPYRRRSTVIEAHGTDRVEAVTWARLDRDWHIVPGSERRIEADAVCVGFGFTPQLELAVSARCAIRDGFVTVNTAQATSVPGVFAAGELTGIGGAVLSADEGTVAGTAAARTAGARSASGARPGPPVRALRRVRSGGRFAAALGRAYPVRPGWQGWLREDTLVCRCEEVCHGALRRAVEERDALGVRSMKLVSRAGLGPCQGRICGRNVAELTGLPESGVAFARRPLAAPLRLSELAEPPPGAATPEPPAAPAPPTDVTPAPPAPHEEQE